MQKNDRFGKEWSSGSNIQEFPSDSQAQQGLSFLGSTPPSFNLHDAMFMANDWKDNWLFDQIKGVTDAYGQTLDLTVDGQRTQLASAIAQAITDRFSQLQSDDVPLSADIDQAPGAENVQDALVAIAQLSSQSFQSTVVFSNPGSGSWQVPDILKSGIRKAHVTVIGGGAGGGRTFETSGGGGGGGGRSEGIFDLSGIDAVNLSVGAGGLGQATTSGSGESGGITSFGSFISAAGGAGSQQQGGTGGMGTGGQYNSSLGPGGPASTSETTSGVKLFVAGSGGGPGGAGIHLPGNNPGKNAVGPGGGGGGSTGSGAAGNGANGIIIVRW